MVEEEPLKFLDRKIEPFLYYDNRVTYFTFADSRNPQFPANFKIDFVNGMCCIIGRY